MRERHPLAAPSATVIDSASVKAAETVGKPGPAQNPDADKLSDQRERKNATGRVHESLGVLRGGLLPQGDGLGGAGEGGTAERTERS